MAFDISITNLTQVAPFTANDATILLQFDVQGEKPDFLQIYAVNTAESVPAGLSDVVAVVDMSGSNTSFTQQFHLPAGAIYTIWLCPRTGTVDDPEDETDGVYWESFCVGKSIVARSTPLPPAEREPPLVSGFDAEPATLKQRDRITVKWTSSQPYDKFLIWWTQNGEAMDQVEVDGTASAGAWTASPTSPGAVYTFSVKGGVWGGILNNYLYSDWGPAIKITAPPHISSLRQFLLASGINPAAQGVDSLMHGQTSLRSFMKV